MTDKAVSSPSARFCAQIVDAAEAPLPEPVAVAARRSLLNVLGTAVGAARSAAVEAIIAAAASGQAPGAEPGRPGVPVPGRTETLSPYQSALAAGTAAHLDDFDDTHLATVIHPGAAAMATVLALEPETGAGGARCLTAFALGCEAQLRIGNAVSPEHYDRGWHITGTCGVFGAAVAAGLLLGLDAKGLERALSLASVMMVGHREAFGSMGKPFHAGKAAANGILAARLAADGLSGITDPLGPDGALSVLASEVKWPELLDGPWGGGWELERNAFKPYPCGIVAHPLIDAAIEASRRLAGPEEITAVSVTCNPLVPELMGRRQPGDGLQARFSSYHAVASGLLDGEAGLAQFSDERATAPDAARLRGLITLHPTPECPRDSAIIAVERGTGDTLTVEVKHARGSLERPLTGEELLAKVGRLASPVLGDGAAEALRGAVDALGDAPDLAVLRAVLTPSAPAPVPVPVPVSVPGDRVNAGESERGTDDEGFTAEIVKLVTGGEPPAAALEKAAARLETFTRVRESGEGGEAVRALRRIAPPSAPPEWEAFTGAAAACRSPEQAAVCAVAAALAAHQAVAGAQGAATATATAEDAVAIGCDAADRVLARLTSAREAGWSATTAATLIGAGAAAARLLRLPGEQARNALGLCATQAAGLAGAEGTGAGAVQAGKAAFDAVEAALLARAGFTAARLPLEGRRGLFALLDRPPSSAG